MAEYFGSLLLLVRCGPGLPLRSTVHPCAEILNITLGLLSMNAVHAVKQISPVLAVADIQETITFYADVLGTVHR
jgi:hypothetical protein